jgi:hypothetical protein
MKKLWQKIKDFFVGVWEEIKEWIKAPWQKFKNWIKLTVLPWFKTNWMQIVNLVVLFIAYSGFNEVTQPWFSFAVGIWIFVLLAYYIFWKLFGFDKVIKKQEVKRLNAEKKAKKK